MNKIDIKDLTVQELKDRMKKKSIPPYRAEQIFYWIYKKGVSGFDAMNNIPKELRHRFDRHYRFGNIKLKEHQRSRDGTEKFLFELSDGNFIESVLISSGRRKTLCISTQVGCKYGCVFCASGVNGFVRDLAPSEILGQILFVQHDLGSSITNFVFMGMGEPLDNYENVSKAIVVMNSKEALGIGARRITISTCGIIPGIEKLKKFGLQVNLSISLHAVNDALRYSLMPINRKYPLKKLIDTCEDFIKKTKRKITLEYILIRNKNDSLDDADELSLIAKRLKVKINLLNYSPISGKKLMPPLEAKTVTFKNRLIRNKVAVTIRQSKGKDIEAACGQLALRKRRNSYLLK